METVKVDIQKLQLLNERVAQTIDALNQVRMSVHGIQHTPAQPWGLGYPTQAVGFAPFAQQGLSSYGQQAFSPYAQTSPYAQSFGVAPFAALPYATPFVGGIQHSSVPFTSPWAQAYGLPQSYGVPQTYGVPQQTPTPYTGNGISHTTWDPTWQMRAMQFPFLQSTWS